MHNSGELDASRLDRGGNFMRKSQLLQIDDGFHNSELNETLKNEIIKKFIKFGI